MMNSDFVHLLDCTFPTPEENLACDDALLAEREATGGLPVLRFWTPREYFVVVGYANRIAAEVNREACQRDGVPVHRRVSGGGTVVQGPGCLDYTLVLPLDAGIGETNRRIMETQRAAIAALLPGNNVTVEGDTDLAVDGGKVSGNAQRRGVKWVMFHGVFLMEFDIARIPQWLPMPTRQPGYRKNRPHEEFVRNLALPVDTVKAALARAWRARTGPGENLPGQRIQQLVDSRYRQPSWTLRR